MGDSYDSTAPGEPVESVDVFYDQISPYGMWVDEPDVGRVFIPDTAGFVPYTTGRWEYTSVGFVWVSNEPFGWATNHYGRWAFSNNYGRWYWLPDTQWGPAWVDWRQTGDEFGGPRWRRRSSCARAGRRRSSSWHYCHHDHLLDANVARYYEPRARVVEIHREARPIEHYATVSNVRVVVGPPAATLRAQHVTVRPAKVDAHVVGRWAPAEVHAQVAHAQEHRATFEVPNRTRIEAHPAIQAAHVKVIEAHPQIKAQVNARVQVGGAHTVEPVRPAEPTHVQPAPPAGRPTGPIEPTHGMPGHERRVAADAGQAHAATAARRAAPAASTAGRTSAAARRARSTTTRRAAARAAEAARRARATSAGGAATEAGRACPAATRGAVTCRAGTARRAATCRARTARRAAARRRSAGEASGHSAGARERARARAPLADRGRDVRAPRAEVNLAAARDQARRVSAEARP